MRIRTLCVGLLMSLSAVATAFAQAPATPSGTTTVTQATPVAPAGVTDEASSAYILGRDDAVEVTLLGRNDYGGRARVQADGTIQLPLIGKVNVAEHTTAEAADMIRAALIKGGYYSDPVVSVEVVGFASRYVVVLGAVGNPGMVPINKPYHLSEILARVGGVREGAAADYLMVRSADGKEKRYPIKELATGGTSQDPYVQAGDKIYAPAADLYYVSGEVKSPGSFPLTGDVTVAIAIARAGGVSENGSDKKVQVTRGGKKIKLGLGDKVQAGDVLNIGERLF